MSEHSERVITCDGIDCDSEIRLSWGHLSPYSPSAHGWGRVTGGGRRMDRDLCPLCYAEHQLQETEKRIDGLRQEIQRLKQLDREAPA